MKNFYNDLKKYELSAWEYSIMKFNIIVLPTMVFLELGCY